MNNVFKLTTNKSNLIVFKVAVIWWKISIFFNWDSLHTRLKQPLQGIELQEKETQKDQSIQEICLERTYS